MRNYDPVQDDWTHQVSPRSSRPDQTPVDRDVCRHTGMPHEFACGECALCGAEDPFEDRPSIIHAYDNRDAHICFAGCRHARTTEGRYTRPSIPDWNDQ